jgi:hypothetical protein
VFFLERFAQASEEGVVVVHDLQLRAQKGVEQVQKVKAVLQVALASTGLRMGLDSAFVAQLPEVL